MVPAPGGPDYPDQHPLSGLPRYVWLPGNLHPPPPATQPCAAVVHRPSPRATRLSPLVSRLSSLASRLSPLAFARACTLCSHSWSVNHLPDSSVASLLVVRSRRSLIPFLSSNNRGSQLRFVSARRKDDRSIRLGERATNPIGEKRCRGAAAVRGGREILSPDYYRSSMTRRMVGCRGQSARDTPTTLRRGSTEGHRGLDLRAL